MRITVTTTPTKLSDLIVTAGYSLSLIDSVKADYKDGCLSIGFDLTGVTADIRIENGFEADISDSARLSSFSAIRIVDLNKLRLVADSNVDILILTA